MHQALPQVCNALAEIRRDHGARSGLIQARLALESGQWPEAIWEELRAYYVAPISDGDLCLSEIEHLAGSLPEQEWQTEHFWEYLTGSPKGRADLRAAMAEAANDYLQTPVQAEELTAESWACHHALLEGYGLWQEAFQSARPEKGQEQAEWACRWLVAVQKFALRLRAQA